MPVAGDEVVGLKLPVPSPSRILTALPPLLATARSSLPSPLKSPTATPHGRKPTPKLVWARVETEAVGMVMGKNTTLELPSSGVVFGFTTVTLAVSAATRLEAGTV